MSTRTDTEAPGVLVSLRRHIVLVAGTALLVGAIAAALLSQRAPSYRANAQVLFAPRGEELQILGDNAPQSDTDRGAASNALLVASRANADAASRTLAGRVTPSDLRDSVSTAAASNSNVVTVTADAPSERDATQRADAWAQAAVASVAREQRRRARDAQRIAQRNYDGLTRRARRTGGGETLRDQIFQLDTLVRLGTGSPRVLQPAAADVSRVDNRKQLIILGVLFGLLVGAGLALLRERSDRRLRDGEDLVDTMDVPVLASVGRSRAILRGAAFSDLPETDSEVFRFLHGRLRFTRPDAPTRSVLVTSAAEGEGKTAVASNLAAAAAASGARALLIEADARRPAIAERLGVAPEPGLVDVLRGETTLADALVAVDVEPRRPEHGAQTLDVLPAGARGADVATLLQSDGMRELLDRSRSVYDLVVFDTPPMGLVADALPLLARVDGVLIATFVGRSKAPEVRRLRWQVSELGGRVLGLVVSGGRPSSGYGYSGRGRAAEPVSG